MLAVNLVDNLSSVNISLMIEFDLPGEEFLISIDGAIYYARH